MKTATRRTALGLGAALLLTRPALAALPDHPALHPDEVVLFIGDSITEGGRQPGQDFNHNMGQDYVYLLAAELGARYPQRNLTFLNRGISGNGAPELAARWRRDVLDLKPNLLSVLVGINDTLFHPGETPEAFAAVYDQLLSETQQALPQTPILLGEPFLLPVGAQAPVFDAHRAELAKRQAVVRDLAQSHGLPLIAYQQAFDRACRRAPAEHWSWDGVHPTYAGHALMAQTWLAAVDAAWPQG